MGRRCEDYGDARSGYGDSVGRPGPRRKVRRRKQPDTDVRDPGIRGGVTFPRECEDPRMPSIGTGGSEGGTAYPSAAGSGAFLGAMLQTLVLRQPPDKTADHLPAALRKVLALMTHQIPAAPASK